MQFLKQLLAKISVYKLMIYLLLVTLLINICLSIFGTLRHNPLDVFVGSLYLVLISNITNFVFTKIYKTKPRFESTTISALIIALIVSPFSFFSNFFILSAVAILTVASKYLIVFNNKHMFNPAATGVFLSALVFQKGASWWGTNVYTLPIIILGGILTLTKINRFKVVLSFMFIYLFTSVFLGYSFINIVLNPPVLFFAFVMLIEPLTSPGAHNLQIAFGIFVSLFYFGLQAFFQNYPYSLESSLLAGNIFYFLARNLETIWTSRKISSLPQQPKDTK